jgi:flagellar motor switch protein FliG
VIEMRPFEFLRRTPAEQIVTFLRNESPQTIALVVATCTRTLAAQVLSNLPEESRPRSRCGSREWARPARTSSSRSRR